MAESLLKGVSEASVKISDQLTETEIKLLMLVVSSIKPEDAVETTYKYSFSYLSKVLGLPEESGVETLSRITKQIISKIFEVNPPDGRRIFLKWVCAAQYDVQAKTVAISISPELRQIFGFMGEKINLSNFDRLGLVYNS